MVILNPIRDEARRSTVASHEVSTEELYRTYRSLLTAIARGRFHIPADEVDPLLHEVVISLLRAEPRQIVDPKSWLVAALCNRCRNYWRIRNRHEGSESGLDATAIQFVDGRVPSESTLVDRLTLQEILEALPRRDRQILQMVHLGGLTAREVALEFGTTPKYAAKMIRRSMLRAMKIIREVGHDEHE